MPSRPHGGRLVNRLASESVREKVGGELSEFAAVAVREGVAFDVENIAYGVYSPLEGFMVEEEFHSVLDTLRLPDDLPWGIPIVLDVSEEEASKFAEGDSILLTHGGAPLALLHVEDIYGYDRRAVSYTHLTLPTTERV